MIINVELGRMQEVPKSIFYYFHKMKCLLKNGMDEDWIMLSILMSFDILR